ncbi:hypothetical protein FQN60_004103 [Etheostoma spectabile]|uniref:MAGUK p55 subfamily member 3 n=1 Tax=Etheostoma spectabile TaxID=54343 RepID=A0A5J5CW82_9PERO|nr:hypothetical protein FQN60_004103 [Etheostoma spectabile]
MKEAMPVLTAGAGLHETLALLTSQLRPDANHKEDMVFLKDVFSERSLGYLMKIHEKLRQYERQSPTPVLHSASSLAEDVAEELQSGPMSTEEKELLHLLTSPHLKAVLSVHDTVAQKNFDPVLPPLPDDFEDELEEESVKIVRLVKNKEPLGATIRRDEATGVVMVARIMRGGAADRSGLVHVGDELREVNGVSVIHKRPDEISQLLSQSQGSITLKIIPAIKEEDRLKDSKVYMRALFDYIPLEDKATPCQEAGLPFKRGDILQVVTQDDHTWWQAKRVGDSNLRAGLIPSKQFQERRLAYRMKMGTLPNPKSPKKTRSFIISWLPLHSRLLPSACLPVCPAYPSSAPGPALLFNSSTFPYSLTLPGLLPCAYPPLFPACLPTEDCDCEGYFNGQYIAWLCAGSLGASGLGVKTTNRCLDPPKPPSPPALHLTNYPCCCAVVSAPLPFFPNTPSPYPHPMRALLRWMHCTLNQARLLLVHPVWRCEAGLCDALTPVIVSPKCKAVAPSCGQTFFTFCSFFPPISGLIAAGLRRSFRLSRKDRQGSSGDGSDPGDSDFLTYEEVTRYQQRPNERPRLVVLIGSLGARINELKQRVIAENTHRYAVAVPHTTRPKKSHEKEGVEYHFVTKQQFDADALNNKFIEHGEYKENQYGTSIEAIRSVQAKNKMCVVDVQPEALKRLRTAEFKPYVIFVKPRVPESRRRRSAATSPGGGEHGRITVWF